MHVDPSSKRAYEFTELTGAFSVREGKLLVNKVLQQIPDDAIRILFLAEYGQLPFYKADIEYRTLRLLRENFLSKTMYSKNLADVAKRMSLAECEAIQPYMDEATLSYRTHVKSVKRRLIPPDMRYMHVAYAPFDAFNQVAAVYRAGALIIFNEKIAWTRLPKRTIFTLMVDIWNCLDENDHATNGTICGVKTNLELPYGLRKEIKIL